jgi:hypothetical protein
MNTLNTSQTQGEKAFVLHGEELEHDRLGENRDQCDLQWRRVQAVILIEGQMRYLVERTD